MKHLKLLLYQLIIFGIVLIVNFFKNKFVNPQFSYVDLLVIAVIFPIYLMLFSLMSKLFKRFPDISLRTKIILAVLAFILAAVLLSAMDGLWYHIKGEAFWGII